MSKIWKVNAESPAQVVVNNESALLVGATNRFIKVNESGTTIYGPTSIVAGSESIKTGGMFVALPDMIQMIPSTTYTPLPGKIPFPPLNVAFGLAEDVAFFVIMLA